MPKPVYPFNYGTLDVSTALLCKKQLSSGQITELLSEDGIEISFKTVERALAEEGFRAARSFRR